MAHLGRRLCARDKGPPAQHNVRTMPVVAVEASIPWANPPNVLGQVDPGAPPIGQRYNGRASNAPLPYPRRQPARTWQTRCVHVAGRCVSSGAIAMVVHAYRDVQGYRLTRTAPVARPLMARVHRCAHTADMVTNDRAPGSQATRTHTPRDGGGRNHDRTLDNWHRVS